MMPGSDSRRANDLLASVTEEMLGDLSYLHPDPSLRIERILLELVRPDPVQPRRVLPEAIHFAFHNNRLTPTQALRELVQMVQVAARQRGRPFNSVLELLPQDDEEQDGKSSATLSPEEQLLLDLVNLAVTIRDDGQVNPLTVVDVSQGVSRLFRIETGERRYWATWLLRDFISEYNGDGMIPCILISAQRSSIFRQAKENTVRSSLTAVAMARQAALLLLTVHGYEIPTYPVDNTFYRQALQLDLRGKREYTEAILSAMGGIDKGHFSHFKALLNLSDEAMELADRYNVEEKKLRCVLTLPPDFHAEIVRQIIDFNLTSAQVKALCESDGLENRSNGDHESLPAAAIKVAKLAQTSVSVTPQEIARALIHQEGDPDVARARLKVMQKLLVDVERYLMSD